MRRAPPFHSQTVRHDQTYQSSYMQISHILYMVVINMLSVAINWLLFITANKFIYINIFKYILRDKLRLCHVTKSSVAQPACYSVSSCMCRMTHTHTAQWSTRYPHDNQSNQSVMRRGEDTGMAPDWSFEVIISSSGL